MKIGVHLVDITPPVGTDLTGFFAREGPAVGVHDPLYAKAVVFDDGRRSVAFVACDLLGFGLDSVAEIDRLVQTAAGIPPSCLFVACTHTHAGGASQFLRGCGTINEPWLGRTRQRIAECVRAAAGKPGEVSEMRVAFGEAPVGRDRRARLRREPTGDNYDPTVGLATFSDAAGTVRAALLNHACHPVMFMPDNRLFSADYCGAAVRRLEREFGTQSLGLFLQGACGDINPLRTAGKPEDVEQTGVAVAEAALKALRQEAGSQEVASGELTVAGARRTVELPLTAPSREELVALQNRLEHQVATAAKPSERRVAANFLDWSREALASAKRTVAVNVSGARIGPLTLIGLSGEVFSRIGRQARALAGAPCFAVGCCNGNIGYLPTEAAFAEGGYECETAYRYYDTFMVAPDSERILLAEIHRVLDDLRP